MVGRLFDFRTGDCLDAAADRPASETAARIREHVTLLDEIIWHWTASSSHRNHFLFLVRMKEDITAYVESYRREQTQEA